LADCRERLAEGDGVLEFGGIAHLAPSRVIPVLLAVFCIAAGGLNMAVGGGANPDIGPCRRDRELIDAVDGLLVGDAGAAAIAVEEAVARRVAGVAGTVGVDVAKAG